MNKTLRYSFAACVILAMLAGPGTPLVRAELADSPYRLIGTVEGNVFAGAVLDDSSGTQIFARIHETLSDGSQIVKVFDDRIVLKRPDGSQGELYRIQNMKSTDPAPRQANPSAPAYGGGMPSQRTESPAPAQRPPSARPATGGAGASGVGRHSVRQDAQGQGDPTAAQSDNNATGRQNRSPGAHVRKPRSSAND